jgi:hypothetical protein
MTKKTKGKYFDGKQAYVPMYLCVFNLLGSRGAKHHK